jgi:Cu+-exporting ATPase
VDPICGMTVAVATARHRADALGRTYYFCCAGCRERFVAAPEKYVASAGAGTSR